MLNIRVFTVQSHQLYIWGLMKIPLLAITDKVHIIFLAEKVITKSWVFRNDVLVKVREGSVKASVKLKVQAFQNAVLVKVREVSVKASVKLKVQAFKSAVFVKVREGSVKASVKLKVQAFKNAVSVKVREATVKEPVKAVKGESMDLQFSYHFLYFLVTVAVTRFFWIPIERCCDPWRSERMIGFQAPLPEAAFSEKT